MFALRVEYSHFTLHCVTLLYFFYIYIALLSLHSWQLWVMIYFVRMIRILRSCEKFIWFDRKLATRWMIIKSWDHRHNYFQPIWTRHSTPDHTSTVCNNYPKVAVSQRTRISWIVVVVSVETGGKKYTNGNFRSLQCQWNKKSLSK